MKITSSKFLKSVARLEHSPELDIPEIAIIGRSNVGKSSLINFLTNRKELAKSSSVPGKTQLINFFLINESWLLVDFPGYGYAKKSKKHRTERVDIMQEYLTEKPTIKDTLLLINGHLPLQTVDMVMIELLDEAKIPFSIVITKTDKAPMKEISKNIKAIKHFLHSQNIPLPDLLMTSSYKGKGGQQVLDHIGQKIQQEAEKV